MLTACYILIGIGILFGVWYNGYRYSNAKHDAEAAKAEAQIGTQRVDALEKERAAEAAEREAKDEHEAAEAAANHDGIDFLRGSFKTRR